MIVLLQLERIRCVESTGSRCLSGQTTGAAGKEGLDHRMHNLLDLHANLIVSGTVENQVDFYVRFDHIVFLSAPVDVIIERVHSRTNNPYGRAKSQQDEIRRYVKDVEPLLRNGATSELDGRLPASALADVVEELMTA